MPRKVDASCDVFVIFGITGDLAKVMTFHSLYRLERRGLLDCGQYQGYRKVDGVAKGSTTETYTAARFEIDNWRWDGVPFFIRTGKLLPVTQNELSWGPKAADELVADYGGCHAPWIAS
jgi:glucose-6-phosphate 1-dehydrogenase